MFEEIPSLRSEPLQKLARTDLMVFKALELTHRPRHERLIDVAQQGIQLRGSIAPIVRNPPPKERIELLGYVLQGQLCLTSEVQVPNRLSHSLHRRGADCWIESSKQGVISETSHQTRPKAIPEEVKLDVRVFVFPLSVFAVDDLGFRRMHLQVALRQPGLKRCLESFGFLLSTTVHQSVIRIPTPWEVRMCPRHPEIKRVVHKKVGQDWTNYPALGRTASSLNRGPIFFHHGRLEPSFDVQESPLARYMFPNGP